VKLSFEGGNVAPAEPPLPTLLEGRQDALTRELVHGIRAQIEKARHLFAVQKNVVFLHHPSISAPVTPGTGENRFRRAQRRATITPGFGGVKKSTWSGRKWPNQLKSQRIPQISDNDLKPLDTVPPIPFQGEDDVDSPAEGRQAITHSKRDSVHR
jgi:hypothetical protein